MKFLLVIMLFTPNLYSDPLTVTIEQNSKKFNYCFANHILKNGLSPKGQITLNFKIDDKSNLLNLNIVQNKTTFKNKKFQECMTKAITNIYFPPAEVGRKNEITHPFTFRSQ